MASITINEDDTKELINNTTVRNNNAQDAKTHLGITLYGQVTAIKSVNGFDYFSIKNIVNNRFNYFDVLIPAKRPELKKIVEECYNNKETIRVVGNVATKSIPKDKAKISYVYPINIAKSRNDRTDNIVKGTGVIQKITIDEVEDKHGRKNKVGTLVVTYKQGERELHANLIMFGFINITRLSKMKKNDVVRYEGFLKNRYQLHAGDMYSLNDIYVSNWA